MIDYLKDRYIEEQARIDSLESKCFLLLAFLTIVIAFLGTIAVVKSESLFQPSLPIEWIKLIAFLIAAFSLVCSWGHSLLVLKIDGSPVLPKDRETIHSLDQADKESRDQNIVDYYLAALEKITAVANEKARYIGLAYEELTMSAWFLSTVTAITIGMELLG